MNINLFHCMQLDWEVVLKMKRWFVLVTITIGVTTYVFYSGYLNGKEKNEVGDEAIQEIPDTKLGGIAEDPVNDTLVIGNIQTDYVKSVKGLMTFDELINKTEKNLELVFNYPFNPEKGYLFSVGYDYDSAIQFYYQSNQQETKTVIFRVDYGEKKNKVTRVYDGTFLKLVAVNPGEPDKLYLYDKDNQEHVMVVN